MKRPLVDPFILDRLLLLQSSIQAAPDEMRLGEQVCYILQEIPGVHSSAIFINEEIVSYTQAQKSDFVKEWPPTWEQVCHLISEKHTTENSNLQLLSIQTSRATYGFFIISLNDYKAFSIYRPYFENTINLVALVIENWKQAKALQDSEEKYRITADFTYDWEEWVLLDGSYKYISPSCKRITGYTPSEFMADPDLKLEIIHPEDRELFAKHLRDYITDIAPANIEFRIICKNGEERWIGHNCQSVTTQDGKKLGRRISNRDITQQKENEEQLRVLSLYDSLTGLYNRNFFEQEIFRLQSGRSLPLGIIVCDVDALKLINDTLGHDFGDELLRNAAQIIKNAFRECDVVSRIGGDEFVVLLPNCDYNIVSQKVQHIRENIDSRNKKSNLLPISISIGYSFCQAKPLQTKALFREADDMMYREKQKHRNSFRRKLLATIEEMVKNRQTAGTRKRCCLRIIANKIADHLELSTEDKEDLMLMSRYYDIGNVGILPSILSKPSSLTKNEKREIRKHSEIGHRLACFFPELHSIADYILMHHERYDGGGYPLSKKGAQIPITSGIISIAVAFIAMTTDRPFCRAMTTETAITEIKRCAGSQFDPILVDTFIKILDKDEYLLVECR